MLRPLRNPLWIVFLAALSVACGQGVLLNPVKPSSGGVATSAGSVSGGSTGSGSSGGGTSGGLSNRGCFLSDGGFVSDGASALKDSEFNPCSDNAECPCPTACVRDPGLDYPGSGSGCEYLCSVSSDCEDAFTVCVDGSCRKNFCNGTLTGASAPGVLGGPCAAAGGPDTGTCLPRASVALGVPTEGECFQAGLVQAGSTICTDNATNVRSGQLCQEGTFCAPTSGFCVPLGPGGCQIPDAGFHTNAYHDHDGCDFSTACTCPLSCVSQPLELTPLCEWPCEDGGPACPLPSCVAAGTCSPRVCTNGFCN